MRQLILFILIGFCVFDVLVAEISLPSVFSDHMVLQRDQEDPVWGWAEPGEAITVSINGQWKSTIANQDGEWRVKLSPMAAGGPYELLIASKDSSVAISDVLVGEVWFCSGQSNMGWPMRSTDSGDVSRAMANQPEIRLLTIPRVGAQEPQRDFKANWYVELSRAPRGMR